MVISGLLIIYMLPAFSGNLISPSMKINFPSEYFELFDWFSRQKKEGRVAHFPIHNLFGWIYYDWGFQGAGFLWFGIDQPFLDRDFDRWSSFNEEYYREMSYAVYSQNLPLLEKLLDKYQIALILVDESVIIPGEYANPQTLFYQEIEELLFSSTRISLAQSFGEKLKVYQTDLSYETRGFIYRTNDFTQAGPSFLWSNFDPLYWEKGTYFSQPEVDSFYPFSSLQGETDSLSENKLPQNRVKQKQRRSNCYQRN